MLSKRYTLVLIHPEGFIHVEAFREIIESIQCGFAELGVPTPALVNQLPTDGSSPIIFGAHHLGGANVDQLPSSTIIFNAEQICPQNPRLPADYYALLKRFTVWDFSIRNVRFLREEQGNPNVRHFPMRYAPVMTKIQSSAEDIDVLFYGAQNARRTAVLDELRARGFKVTALLGVYGAERDDLIAKSKLVLNMHFDAGASFEAVRVVPLMANAKAVVTEIADDIPEGLIPGLCIADYDNLADRCVGLLSAESSRKQLELSAFRCVRELGPSVAEQLAALTGIGRPMFTEHSGPTSAPSVLVAGSGYRRSAAYLNADKNPAFRPDWCVDFEKALCFGQSESFGRYGQTTLARGQFDVIIAHHVLEHIPDLVLAMTNFLSLLRHGGVLQIEVPYDLSYGAWQDPTHVRAFNERSWLYFSEWSDYIGWTEDCLDLVTLAFILSPYGLSLRNAGKSERDIMATPRAVDAMRLTLVKRRKGIEH